MSGVDWQVERVLNLLTTVRVEVMKLQEMVSDD